LAEELKFTNRDIAINHVPKFGSGSTFDDDSYAGRGSQMKVLERWKILAKDSRYLELIEMHKDEFDDISENICEFSPPNL
jgi:hypothetical protein